MAGFLYILIFVKLTDFVLKNYIITQFIFLNEGKKEDFLQYEEAVLPLLKNHNGLLRWRIRPDKENIIHPAGDEQPFEIHIVYFDSKDDFLAYKNDPERLKHAGLAESAVKKILLIESEGTNRNEK